MANGEEDTGLIETAQQGFAKWSEEHPYLSAPARLAARYSPYGQVAEHIEDVRGLFGSDEASEFGDEELEDFQPSYGLTGIQPSMMWGQGGGGGGGKAKSIGNIKVEAKGRAPLAAYAALGMAKQALKDDIALQLGVRGNGLGIAANINEDLAGSIEKNAAETYEKVNRIFSEAEDQLQGVAQLIDAARGNRINPGQFFANVGDAGTFTASIAIAAGHLASALGGGPNTAYELIKGAIDRNVKAQIYNQQHDRAMISHQIAFVDRLQSMGINVANAANVHRGALTAAAQAQLASVSAETASQETKAMIKQLDSRLELDVAQSVVKSYEDITASASIKYYSMAQADAAARAVAGAARSAVGAQTGQTGVRVPRRPATGAGMAPGPAAAGRGRIPTPPEPAEGASAAEQAQAAARSFQAQFRGNPTGQQIERYVAQLPPDVQAEAARLPREAFAPRTSPTDVHPVNVGKRVFHLVKTPLTKQLEAKSPKEADQRRQTAEASLQIHQWMQEIDQILKHYNAGQSISFGPNGEPIVLSLTEDQAALRNSEEIARRVYYIANAERTKLGSDAIRSISEWDVWKKIKGVAGTDEQSIRKAIQSVFYDRTTAANLRRSAFRPSLELQDTIVRQDVLPYYYVGAP